MSASGNKRRRTACVQCRQMKVKCDYVESFPASCSRCKSSELQCYVDTSFRRTAKRDRLERLEKQVRELSTGKGTSTGSEAATPMAPYSLVNNEHHSLPYAEHSFTSVPKNDLSEPSDQCGIVSQSLDGIELSAQEVTEWIDEYYTNYHEKFPLLPSKETFVQDSQSNPLLLWSVIGVASRSFRRSRDHEPDLCVRLAPAVNRLAADQTLLVRPELPSIQALLLLCCWPFPSHPTLGNPSWMYCGMATHQALLRGLHRPHHLHEYNYQLPVDEEVIASRVRTWVACFIVNQSLSTIFGVPATIGPDHTILEALANRGPPIPPVLHSLLHISFRLHSLSSTLGNNECTPDGLVPEPFALVRIHEMEFGQLEQRHIEPWNTELMIVTLAAKLRMYSYALMRYKNPKSPHDMILEADASRAAVYFSRVRAAAMDLIELCCSEESRKNSYRNRHGSETPHWAEAPVHWTIFEIHGLVFAAICLFKVARFWKIDPDPIATNNALTETWNVLKSLSRTKDDHFSHICDMLKYVLDADWSSCEDQGILVRSRMSAGIAVEMVWRAKDSGYQWQRANADINNQNESSKTDANAESPSAMFANDEMLLASLDFLCGDWNAPDMLFAGM